MPEGTSSPDINRSQDRETTGLTVNLNDEFQPFNNHNGESTVTLHSGILPDLQFKARASGHNPEFRAELQQPTAGVSVNERRDLGKGWGGIHESTWFSPDFLENAVGLSIVVSSPEGQFKARLNPKFLREVKLIFGEFVRQNPDQGIEYLVDQLKGPEDLAMLKFAFRLDEEDKGKLPRSPRSSEDPNEYLERYIEVKSGGDENVANELRHRVFSDRRMIRSFLGSHSLLAGPM